MSSKHRHLPLSVEIILLSLSCVNLPTKIYNSKFAIYLLLLFRIKWEAPVVDMKNRNQFMLHRSVSLDRIAFLAVRVFAHVNSSVHTFAGLKRCCACMATVHHRDVCVIRATPE